MRKLFFGIAVSALFSLNINAQIKITHDDAKKIAVEHNNYLFSLVKNNPKTQDEINKYFEALNFENLSQKEKLEYFSKYTYDSNLELVKKHINNPEVYEVINNSNLIVENESLDLKQINIELDKQVQFAENKLKDLDLEVCLVYIEVLKKSTEFWIEPQRGGNGLGYNFLINVTGSSTSKKPIPKGTKVLAADAMGASGGLIIGAVSAPWTGIAAPATFFAVVGASAAWSSGCAALGL